MDFDQFVVTDIVKQQYGDSFENRHDMAAVGIQYYSGVDAFDLRHFADKQLTV